MDTRSEEPHLHLSGEEWDTIVAQLFSDPVAESAPHRWHRLDQGAGIGNELFRVSGTARLPSGVRPWTVVVKVFIVARAEADPERTRPDGREYWKREWHVYRSDWQQHLPGPFRAARCLGSGEFDDSTAEVAWIALEDLTSFDQRPWPLSLFGEVARHIGAFTGSVIDPPDPPIWLSRHWHLDLIDGVAPAIESLPHMAGHPLVKHLYPGRVLDDLLMIWERRYELLGVQDQLTRALAHNDLFPRNVFIRDTPGASQSIAIDWAYCGIAPIGQELTSLVGSSQVFGECQPTDWDVVEEVCVTGYIAGLRSAGWAGPADDVRLGYLASSMLQGLLAITPNLALAQSDPPLDGPLPFPGFNCTVHEYVDRMGALNGSWHSRVQRTWALLGR